MDFQCTSTTVVQLHTSTTVLNLRAGWKSVVSRHLQSIETRAGKMVRGLCICEAVLFAEGEGPQATGRRADSVKLVVVEDCEQWGLTVQEHQSLNTTL